MGDFKHTTVTRWLRTVAQGAHVGVRSVFVEGDTAEVWVYDSLGARSLSKALRLRGVKKTRMSFDHCIGWRVHL